MNNYDNQIAGECPDCEEMILRKLSPPKTHTADWWIKQEKGINVYCKNCKKLVLVKFVKILGASYSK